MLEIITKEHPILRGISSAVAVADILKPETQKIIENMRIAVQSQDDGVALAAPQIGISLRMFVIAPRVFEETPSEQLDERSDPALPLRKSKNEHFVYINPEITKLSKRRAWVDEGCLSVRWLYGKVSRASKASVRAYDENGKQFERGASGLLAQIFQHEIDHLNGILFIDNARDIVDIPPQKANQ
ncbi:MAG: peptide deformylase [Parcubacteria group bacterium Gr01-1014_48]|nr:MAG: peptide deformylase [Parcubacteria group bacterium Greene0416_14]TSC73322.1 MAG: peptide deformylase [Parcubacteria group bacterium Gr01-1014_48]TSC99949.1 MAG: peptide deformylase [Parcubacteria group bacterium Greene1014_15]TSD07413.1 MAG: peptide deformylase [Parcubacteria group bacterium Greene0714_4]